MASAAAQQRQHQRQRQRQRIRSGSFIGSFISGGFSGRGFGVSGSGIFPLPLSLDINLHTIPRLNLDGSSLATKVSVAASAAAYEDEGRLPNNNPDPGCRKHRQQYR